MTEMPKRIIVVDPSLRDAVGHHLEYDLSLLNGARELGLDLVVLAHKDAAVLLPANEKIVAAFSEDMWGTRSSRVDWDVRAKVLAHRIIAGATVVLPILAGAAWLVSKGGLSRRLAALRRRGGKFAVRVLRSLTRPTRAIIVLDIFRELRDRLAVLPRPRWLVFLALLNPRFYFEARKQLRRLEFGQRDLVFCHMATYRHLLEWGALASGLPKAAFPRIVLLLRYPPPFYAPSTLYTRLALRLLETAYSEGKLRLATDSERLAKEFARYTCVPFEILPIPHTGAHRAAGKNGGPREKICFASLGNARAEKGILEILDAVKLVQEQYEHWRDVEFFLQLNDPDRECAAAVRGFLSELPPNVRCGESALPSEEYQRLVAEVDVVLVPYRAEVYASRTSGVFLEAVAAGKPVIATANTWMTDELARFGAGVAVPSHSSRALAGAIIELHRNFRAYRVRARESAPRYAARHSATALLHQLAARRRLAPDIRRKALVLFPWGGLFEKASGASIRTTHLIDFLQSHGWTVSARIPRSRLESLLLHLRFGVWPRSRPGRRLDYMHRRWHRTRRFKLALNKALIGCDAVFVEYTFLADMVKPFAVTKDIPMIVTSHDVLAAEIADAPASGGLLKIEAGALRLADLAVSVSRQDQEVFRAAGADTVVVPNSISIRDLKRLDAQSARRIVSKLGVDAGRPIVLFFGSRYLPNREARDFLKRMAPAVRKRLPDAVVVVAGSCAQPSDSGDGFLCLGIVGEEAKAALYERCSLVAIPLFRGTGTSLKTIEAMAYGRTVVGTSVAFRGLDVRNRIHAIIEDDLSRFPTAVIEMLERRDLARALGEEARTFSAQFDHRATYAPYAKFLEDWAAAAAARRTNCGERLSGRAGGPPGGER